jgi:MFS transporter, DHA2 family, methylenomycin A resistance protein
MNRIRRRSTRAAVFGVCLSFFMVILDTTVINVALPAIQADLGASLEGLQWSVNAYTLAFASLLLSAGALGDRLGPKRVFLGGLVLFTAASAACSLSPCLWVLVGARFAQGVGAAALMPGSLSLITHTFPDPSDRARGISLWAGMGGLAISSGPVLGGLLIEELGWRTIFLINVPVGALALVLTLRQAELAGVVRNRSLDPAGQTLAIVALAALTYVLIDGPEHGWYAPRVLLALPLALAAGLSFVVAEARGPAAMLPLGLFRSRAFAAANVVGLCLNFGLYGLLFVLSLFFQEVCRYTPLATGLVFLPLTAAIAVTLWQSGRISLRFGPRSPMIAGMGLAAVGCLFLLGVVNWNGFCGGMVAGFVMIGLGIGMTMPAMTMVVLASAPPEQSGIASGVLSASRQAGGALGVALLGSVAACAGLSRALSVDLAIAGAAFLLSCVLSCTWVGHNAALTRSGDAVVELS